MNWSLIAANGVVFLLLNVAGGEHFANLGMEDGMRWGLIPGSLRPENFLSCMFVHGGIAHLLGNMWFLHIFGDNVEDKFGRFGYLAFYLGAGVVASLAYLLFGRPLGQALGVDESHAAWAATPLVGASGAIAGVTGAYLVLFPRARIRLVLWFLSPFFFAAPAIVVIGMFFLQDLLLAVLPLGEMVGGVAYAAHVGGSVTGIVTALILKPFLRARGGSHWDQDTGFSESSAKGGAWGPIPSAAAEPPRLPAGDLRQQILGAVLDQRMDLALSLYREWISQPRREVLAPAVEIEIGHEYLRRGAVDEAMDCYRRFLGSHPRAEQAPEAKFRLGMIHARVTGDHARAREWLMQALAEHGDEEVRSAARRALSEL
jgi:membrane associated rhomboid family serine protease